MSYVDSNLVMTFSAHLEAFQVLAARALEINSSPASRRRGSMFILVFWSWRPPAYLDTVSLGLLTLCPRHAGKEG